MIKNKSLYYFLASPIILLLSACAPEDSTTGNGGNVNAAGPADTLSVTGTITYRERMALGPEAVAEVSLLDVSRADAKATLVAKQRITRPGQVPIRFELQYAPEDIDERMTYAVSARVQDAEGKLLYRTDTVHHALTRGAGESVTVELIAIQ
jgi:putative lipoprotein